MKKLMIAAAIVCAAAASYAAQIDWSIGGNTWTYADGTKPGQKIDNVAQPQQTIYLIDAAKWTLIEAAIKDGATSFDVGDPTDTKKPGDVGIIGKADTTGTKGAISSTTAKSQQLTAGDKYGFAYLVIDTRGDEVQYFASLAATQTAAYDPTNPDYSEAMSVSFAGSHYSTSGLSGGWQTVSVPEPTSGLLLLLGIGAMALRRRRA